jgi:hypothetical protein
MLRPWNPRSDYHAGGNPKRLRKIPVLNASDDKKCAYFAFKAKINFALMICVAGANLCLDAGKAKI